MANQKQTLVLIRTDLLDTCTIGELYFGDKFICYTLEDKVRSTKIYGETAIPYGTYKVIINYSQRFKKLMPLLLNVPNFEGIRVHRGLNNTQTKGCLLVGTKKGKDSILYSSAAYDKVFNLINTLLKSGELEITIKKPEVVQEVILDKSEPRMFLESKAEPAKLKKTTLITLILNLFTKWKNYFRN